MKDQSKTKQDEKKNVESKKGATAPVKNENKSQAPVKTASKSTKPVEKKAVQAKEKKTAAKKDVLVIESIYNKYITVSNEAKKEFDKLIELSKVKEDNTSKAIDKFNSAYVDLCKKQDELLKATLDKVAQAKAKAEEDYKKAIIDINKEIKADKDSAIPRQKDNKDKIEKALKDAKDEYDKAMAAVAKAKEELESKNSKAHEDEAIRAKAVNETRAESVEKNEKEYSDQCIELKEKYDTDISNLNKQIKKMHNDYFGNVDSVKAKFKANKDAINKKEEKLKCDTSAKIKSYEKTFNEQSGKLNKQISAASQDDKATIKQCNKELKLAEKTSNQEIAIANKELSTAMAGFEKERVALAKEKDTKLHEMEQAFMQSIPPVENKLRLRKYQYDVMLLSAKNAKSKKDKAIEISVFLEKSENDINNSSIDRDNKIILTDIKSKTDINDAKFELDKKLIAFEENVFKANEDYKLARIVMQEEFVEKATEINKSKTLADSDNQQKIAEINEEYSKIDFDIDLRYNILNARFENAFATANTYYDILNKYNGLGADTLKGWNSNINDAINADLSEEDLAQLLNATINGYVKDTEVSVEGVLATKNALIVDNQQAINVLCKTRYDNEKNINNQKWQDALSAQENQYKLTIESLDNEYSDFESDIKSRIGEAKQSLQNNLDSLMQEKNNDIKQFNDFKAMSEKNLATETNALRKKVEDAKASIKKQVSEMKQRADCLAQQLSEQLSAKETEQQSLNAESEKLTLKTIKILLKKGEVNSKSKWWVVEI